jgi:hypothetical protein
MERMRGLEMHTFMVLWMGKLMEWLDLGLCALEKILIV